MNIQTYKFRNLATIETLEFEGSTILDALNLASIKWFGGTPVVDYLTDNSDRITLLSNSPNGNVIGRIYWFR